MLARAIMLIVLTSFLPPALAQEVGPEAIAIIVKSEGPVRYQALDQDRTRAARKGQILFPGESIQTGEESFCTIKFLDDGSLVRLIGNGEVIISGQRDGAVIKKRLQLLSGTLYCKILPGNQNFRIETVSALVAVRGTEFWALQDAGTQSLKLLCLEGLVELENDAGKVLVRRGQAGEVKTRQKQAVVRLMRVGELPSEVRQKASVTTLDVGFTNADGERKVLRIQFQE